VAREPRVRLDRERVRHVRFVLTLDRLGDPVAVSLGGQVAVELRDQQPPVGEDQYAERPRRIDEPGCRDRLPRCRRVAEAEAADGARVPLGRKREGQIGVALALGGPRRLELVLLFFVGFDIGSVAVPVAIERLRRLLRRGDQLGQHPGERVDLVAAELGAGREARRSVGKNALEPEHQRVAPLPLV
jgi:hypothetical protein